MPDTATETNIYQVFLAAEMKSIGAALHTDGDYAPIVIIAHEWGHGADRWCRASAPPDYR
jgi:hypothetical protein